MSESTKLAVTGGDDAAWLAALLQDGYCMCPDLAPGPIVEAANDAIRDDLARNYDSARQLQYDHESYCPDIRGSRAIRALLENAAVTARVDAAVEYANLVAGPPQIALRRACSASVASPPPAHIDGIATAHNGIVADELQTFTLLVGVFLSDAPQEYAGNFTVWPGSHRQMERYFRQRGPRAMREGMPPIPLCAPRQILTTKGDVILCHYQLAHAAAANVSACDRIAVFFRLSLIDLALHRWRRLIRMWDGWRIRPDA
jgi:hypothetical protein